MTAFAPAALFGKIPAHADFVRVRAPDPVSRSLVLWLEEGSEAAKRTGAPAALEPARFLFWPVASARALLGVLAGSVDRVGRSFPLAVFAAAEGQRVAPAFAALPETGGAFLDAATDLIVDAARLAPADLAGRVDRLPSPGDGALDEADARARAAAGRESGREMLARLFGDPAAGQRHYALHCFQVACQAVRGQAPRGQGLVLDCPVQRDLDRWAWLELARRSLGWTSAPSFFWRGAPAPRLLIALGAVPAAILGVLARPDARDPKLWPLTTAQPAAVAAARRALGPATLEGLERPELSVLGLIDLVTPSRPDR